MVAALPLLSLATGAGSAVAGASAAGTFLGVSAGTLSAVSAGIGAVSSIFGGLSAQAGAEAEAAQVRLQAQADRTQAAEEEFNRQKRLKAILATQNAVFGASGLSGGSQNNIQLADVGEANRQRGQAELLGDVNDTQANIQSKELKRAGRAKLLGSISRAGSIIGGINNG
jgi:hypothetical protein